MIVCNSVVRFLDVMYIIVGCLVFAFVGFCCTMGCVGRYLCGVFVVALFDCL